MNSLSYLAIHISAKRLYFGLQLGLVVALNLGLVTQRAEAAPSAAVRTVALSGQPAPGAPHGATFRDFAPFQFSLNDRGQVALLGSLTGGGVDGRNNEGIWSEGSGSLALLAREDDVAPNADAILRFDYFSQPVINNSGQVSFSAGLTNFSLMGNGIWSDRTGSVALVAGSGMSAPGAPSGATFGFAGGHILNDAGQTAFRGGLTGGGVDNTNSEGIWSEGSGSLALVAREGSPAVGMPEGIVFDVMGLPVLNNAGQSAFYAYVVNSDFQSGFGQGVWSERAGSLSLVARSEIQAPGTPSGTTFLGFSDPALNDSGQTAFWAYLDGSNPAVGEPYDDGIWSEGSGSLDLVARRGTQAPGMPIGVSFGNKALVTFDNPVLNNVGQTAFRGYVGGEGIDFTNNEGIWLGGADSLTLVARAGSQAPGTSSGVNFGAFFPWHGGLELNDAGQIAFTAFLAGDIVPFQNDIGLWATDRSGSLQLVARTGDLLEIAPGDFRTIQTLSFILDGTGNSDGRASGLNRLGQVAFWAQFDDGEQGIFVSNRVAVPEPSTFLLVCYVMMVTATRRAHRLAPLRLLISALAITTLVHTARADIFEWEYIDSANPSLGKQQSTTLTPDGEGMSAGAGANLTNLNLTKAYLSGMDLSPYLEYDYYYISGYARANLTSVNLSQADLSFASFNAATLTGEILTGADVRGANFDRYDQYGYSYAFGYGTGLTLPQLTSTASYAAHDLSGISLGSNNLVGANLGGFNLTDARFAGADLTNVNFSNSNLTRATVSGALTGMNLAGAEVRGASLWGVTKAQLYSTASYQAGDLTGITLYGEQSGWNFAGKILTDASFQGNINLNNSDFSQATLSGVSFSYLRLRNANFTQADLTNAILDYANLSGANFSGAVIQGANFSGDDIFYPGSGLTPVQLSATASYQAHNLAGLKLRGNNLTGANLAGQNLTNVDFTGAALAGANLTGAEVRGASFQRDFNRNNGGITVAQLQSTGSYLARDLSGIGLGGNNLAGANLVGQNLTNANFDSDWGIGADLTGANLSQANLTNARFGIATLAGATLVETNLEGVDLHLSTLTDANMARANLSSANFGGYFIVVVGGEEGGGGHYHFPGSDLTGANLSSTNLTNANFAGTEDYLFGFPHPGANLTNANLTGADARGADFQYAVLDGATTDNLIQYNGHIAGLDLSAGASLMVRDYDGNPAAAEIVVDENLVMDASSKLLFEFDADPWGSTISFAPGIPVSLGGTLELDFASGIDADSQIGRTIALFDWAGVTPTGAFMVSTPYSWDLSNLYTTGEVTLAAIPGAILGDYDSSGLVDGRDFLVWQRNFGTTELALLADGNGDRVVDAADYAIWRDHFGQTPGGGAIANTAVPEPASLVVVLIGLPALLGRRIWDERQRVTIRAK